MATTNIQSNNESIILLPECLPARWPFKRILNPACAIVDLASKKWVLDFPGLDPRISKIACDSFSTGLVALAYPDVSAETLRILADFMHMFFIYDDFSDKLNGEDARELGDCVMAVLRNPEQKLADGLDVMSTTICEMFRSFWVRIQKIGNPVAMKRLIEHYQGYINSVSLEADDRENSTVQDLNTYLSIRHGSIATRMCFDMLLLWLDVPELLLDSPKIMELELLVTELVIIANDIASYNKEQCCGEDQQNIITVLMYEKRCSIQAAMDEAGEMFESRIDKFLSIMETISHPENPDLGTYIKGLGNWATANYEWNYECPRYLMGPFERKTQRIKLLMKRV